MMFVIKFEGNRSKHDGARTKRGESRRLSERRIAESQNKLTIGLSACNKQLYQIRNISYKTKFVFMQTKIYAIPQGAILKPLLLFTDETLL